MTHVKAIAKRLMCNWTVEHTPAYGASIEDLRVLQMRLIRLTLSNHAIKRVRIIPFNTLDKDEIHTFKLIDDRVLIIKVQYTFNVTPDTLHAIDYGLVSSNEHQQYPAFNSRNSFLVEAFNSFDIKELTSYDSDAVVCEVHEFVEDYFDGTA